MQDASKLFDAKYYQNGLGLPYERNDYWLTFFSAIAEQIIRSLRPRTVFDAGCALGFLVESFWDRGVEAHGVDISEFGISQVRRDIRPYCRQGSITDSIEGHYDLITCIEVLEHLRPEQTEAAIANLASATETILFSSTPIELTEPTHFNIRPTIGWLKLFKDAGFWPDYGYDAAFLAPHAILLRKQHPPPEDSLFLLSDAIRWKCAFVAKDRQYALLNQSVSDLTASLARGQQELAGLEELRAKARLDQAEIAKARAEAEVCRRKLVERQAAFKGARAEIEKLNAELQDMRADLAQASYNLRAFVTGAARSQILDEAPGLRASVSKAVTQTKLAVMFRRSALQQRQAELLRQLEILAISPLFDAVWYLKTYPDVAASKANPLIHYLEYGGKEGRHPSADFDAGWYLATYPDVGAAGMIPLLHFLEFGAIEGRECRPLGAKQEPDAATLLSKEGLVDAEQLWRAELIANSSFFDSAWYREQYPDVAMEGIDPVVHYLKHGASEGRNPGPNFSGEWYLKYHRDVAEAGLNPLIHYLESGIKEKREIRPATDDRSVGVLLQKHFSDSTPLTAFSAPQPNRRITIVADGLDMGTPYDGISTALILAALLAKRADAGIRLVTRKQPASAGSFGDILAANGVAWRNDVEFLYAPAGGSRPLAVSDKDTFLTTSWRSARSVQNLVDPSRIFCLLQEDERTLYPHGDERLRCEETMLNPAIRWVVNSELLFQHLTTGTEACQNIRRNGIWHEPAFPESTYHPRQEAGSAGKKQVFFYANRGDATNLYWRGLEVIARAIEDGVLRSQEWEFNLVGLAAERIFLPANAVVKTYPNPCWLDYTSLIRTMDLAVCLTGTGHSNYPPLSLAASGAVVVTNSAGAIGSLTRYSENIISTNPSLDELGTALAEGARIARDNELRRAHYSRNGMLREWDAALGSVTEWMTELIGSQG